MMIRLTEAREKNWFIFNCIRGGHCALERLADMGLLPGEKIRVINNTGIGPVMIEVKGARLALGYGIAGKIMGEEVCNER